MKKMLALYLMLTSLTVTSVHAQTSCPKNVKSKIKVTLTTATVTATTPLEKFNGSTPPLVNTLQEAKEYLDWMQKCALNPDTFEISVIAAEDQGSNYFSDHTYMDWDIFPKAELIIKGVPNSGGEKPIFDGSGTTKFKARFVQFLVLTRLEREIRIEVSGIKFQNFWEVINLRGLKGKTTQLVPVKYLIQDNDFENIGNKYATGTTNDAMAVVRMTNVSNSLFIGNTFSHINNNSGSGLHAFYVANSSSQNLFEGNNFINHMTGSPVKIRNGSDDNKVLSNRFQEYFPVAIQVRHYDKPDKPEIPSVGTVEEGNLFLSSTQNKPLTLFPAKSNRDRMEDYKIATKNQKFVEGILKFDLTPEVRRYAICDLASQCVDVNRGCVSMASVGDNGNSAASAICSSENSGKTLWIECKESRLLRSVGGYLCVYDFLSKKYSWATGKTPISSLLGGKTFKNGCSSPLSCVFSDLSCVGSGSNKSAQLCFTNNWKECGEPLSGVSIDGKVCTKTVAGGVTSYAWQAISLSAGKYSITSLVGSSKYKNLCPSAYDCVNSSNKCFTTGTGSPRALCFKNEWKSCSASTLNQSFAGKQCLKTPNGLDQIWQ